MRTAGPTGLAAGWSAPTGSIGVRPLSVPTRWPCVSPPSLRGEMRRFQQGRASRPFPTFRVRTVPTTVWSTQQRSALASDLRKCSFIYQPPGTGKDAHCPDYTQLWRALEAGDDPALAQALEQAAACPDPLQ